MKKTYLRSFYALIFSVLLISSTQVASNRYFEIAKGLELFAEVYKEINTYYVDVVNPTQLMQTGIDAMMSSLDPYTNYIPHERIEEYLTEENEQYAGLGTQTIYRNGKLVVSMIIPESPAYLNGLKIGDEILAVDGRDVTSMTEEEINKSIKGQANTAIRLRIKRFGSSTPLDIAFAREKVTVSSVPNSLLLPNNIGYVKLTEFNRNAGRSVRMAVDTLLNSGAEAIILDLRNNGGGLLVESVNITNIFIPKGEEVVTTRGKIVENNATYRTNSSPTNTEIPVAVLINSGSASASEIVSGTLQDYDRAIIVGSKSYGKGLVQVGRPLSYKSQLKVTTAKYYTPSGRCIQALDYSNRNPDGSVGVVPDSVKQEFRTRNNRKVYDGGGVDPDIIVKEKISSPVLIALHKQGLIFDFATEYYYSHESIDGPREFQVSEELFQQFRQWTKEKDFSYRTKMEDKIDSLEANAKREKYYDQISGEINSLREQLSKRKAEEFDKYAATIRDAIRLEIIGRYYFQSGQVESTLNEDLQIEAASSVLKNEKEYKSILGIED